MPLLLYGALLLPALPLTAVSAAAQPPSLEKHYLPRTYFGRALYFLERGDSRMAVGDFAGAAGDYSSGLTFLPDSAVLRLARAHALAAIGDFKAAADDLNTIAAVLPRGVEELARRYCELDADGLSRPAVSVRACPDIGRRSHGWSTGRGGFAGPRY